MTAEEFTPAGASPTTSASTPSQTASTTEETAQESVAPVVAKQSSGLTVAEKAGIAVAVVVGACLVASVAFFMVRRKRSPAKDVETPGMTKVASFTSTDAPRY